jgi:hypothetical protein
MKRGVDASSVISPELTTPAAMAHQRNQPSMGDSLKTPHSVSLKVLRCVYFHHDCLPAAQQLALSGFELRLRASQRLLLKLLESP